MEYVLARTPDPKKAYLELHGGTWRVTVSVPVPVRRALGATKLQTILYVVLPQALPGILTGGILAVNPARG